MPKRLTQHEFDDIVYSTWFRYLCSYGMKQAMKILFAAYKELRRQDREQKGKVKK